MTTRLETPCREYWGHRNAQGYGRRWRTVDGRRRSEYIHRWVWEQINGPIPAGKIVMHRCDNPPCFRHDHLVLGTRPENSQDMVAKGRAQHRGRPGLRATCKRGHEITVEHGVRRCWVCKRMRDRGEL